MGRGSLQMRVATAEQCKRLDEKAINERGVPSLELMERAAAGVARQVLALLGEAKGAPVTVLCGPGNNGGDGVAAARLLRRAGVAARAFLVGAREKMTADTREMARRLEAEGGCLEDLASESMGQTDHFRRSRLFVDAILGVGLHDQVRGPALTGLAILNTYGQGKTVAVDLPSGVEANTGVLLGSAPACLCTVTFTLPKPGHFVGKGGLCTGRLVVEDIGIPADLVEGETFPITAVDRQWVGRVLPRRAPDAHKGDFGRVYIVGGSVGFTGAPVLAARGALRSGAGLIYLGVPEKVYPIIAGKCDEVMAAPLPGGSNGALAEEAALTLFTQLPGKDACLLGPGLGRSPAAELVVRTVVSTVRTPLVLDADGINAMEGHIDTLDARRQHITVITPHDGEFARLGVDLSGGDRIAAARDFAAAHSCVVVLKGHCTVVAAPDGRVFLNTTGNCGMAKGGSGDILGGMILSLMGQGIHPVEAAAAAVWLHGYAGDLCAAEKGTYGMTPGDLAEKIPQAILDAMEEN